MLRLDLPTRWRWAPSSCSRWRPPTSRTTRRRSVVRQRA